MNRNFLKQTNDSLTNGLVLLDQARQTNSENLILAINKLL